MSLRPLATLRTTISVALVGGVVITTLCLLLIFSRTQQHTSRTVSKALVDGVASATEDHVSQFFAGADAAVALTLHELGSGVLRGSDRDTLERHFAALLATHQDLVMLSYGDEQGQFVILVRQPDGAIFTKRIDGVDTERTVTWLRRNKGDDISVVRTTEVVEDDYDPRTRPWYRAASLALEPTWIDPYVFYTTQFRGMTVAAAHREQGRLSGVVAADFRLVRLREFVSSLSVAEHGFAVLFDVKGQVLAAPSQSAALPGEAVVNSGPQHPALKALSHTPAFKNAIAGEASNTAYFSVNGEAWLGTVRSVPVGDKRLLMAVLLPEADFLSEVEAANWMGVLAGLLFATLALIIALLVSERISRSLRVLVEQSQRIARLDLGDPEPVFAGFREVADALDAFEGMRLGLRSFHKYLPVKLVRSLLSSRQEATLGAELREVTLFFSDVAGFTTISERLSPMEMAVLLGEYLDTVTEQIEACDGTVVQYVGDAVMAFWGAPVEVENHPVRACEAALRCIDSISKIREGQWPQFPTRIGVHTVQVAVGHFGSERRMYYGAVGDGVNTAARLEAINKPYGTQITVSASTWERVKDGFEGRRVDLVAVKGRQQPVAFYELLGAKGTVSESRLALARGYEAAFDLYLQRRWRQAILSFEAVLSEHPEDVATAVLLARCVQFEQSPPPREWAGVHKMLTKS